MTAVMSLSAGCYRYSAVTSSSLSSTEDVRLTLTRDGSAALTPILGRSTSAVEGRVVRVSDSAFVLAVSSTLKRGDEDSTSTTRTIWAGESVTIPRGAVAAVEERSLDGKRTTFATGITAALGVLAAKLLVHGIGSSGGDSGGGPTVVSP